jgi:hypothetical protein
LQCLRLCKLYDDGDDDDDDDDGDDDDRQHVKLKKASPRRNECSLCRAYNCLRNKTKELSITNVQHQMSVNSNEAARRAGTIYCW